MKTLRHPSRAVRALNKVAQPVTTLKGEAERTVVHPFGRMSNVIRQIGESGTDGVADRFQPVREWMDGIQNEWMKRTNKRMTRSRKSGRLCRSFANRAALR